jgi:hypothetical protein
MIHRISGLFFPAILLIAAAVLAGTFTPPAYAANNCNTGRSPATQTGN